jgi:DNA-directed RNA polymerase alpha subunit
MITVISTTTNNDEQIIPERFKSFLELTKSNSIESALQEAAILAISQGNWNKVMQLADFAVGIEAGVIYPETVQYLNEDDTDIKSLELPARIIKVLNDQGIMTITDLIEWTFEELMTIKGIRIASAQTIAIALERKLAITLPGWTEWQSQVINKNQHRCWKQPRRFLNMIST